MHKYGIDYYEYEKDGRKYLAEKIFSQHQPRSRLVLNVVNDVKRDFKEKQILRHDNFIQIEGIKEVKEDYCLLTTSQEVDMPLSYYLKEKKPSLSQIVSWMIDIAEVALIAEKKELNWSGISLNSLRVDSNDNIKMLDPDIINRIKQYRKDITDFFPIENYLAPEVMEEVEWTEAGRIYSLGVVFYYLITGQSPFGDENKADIFDKKISSSALEPRYLNHKVSPSLSNLIMKMITKKRDNRISSWIELIEKLKELDQEHLLKANKKEEKQNKFRAKKINKIHQIKEKVIFTFKRRWKLLGMVSLIILMIVGTFTLNSSQPVITSETEPLEVVEIFYEGINEKDTRSVEETSRIELGTLEKLLSRSYIMEKMRDYYSGRELESQEKQEEMQIYGLKDININEIQSNSEFIYQITYTFFINKEEGRQTSEMEDTVYLEKVNNLWQIVKVEGDIEELIKGEVEF